MRAALVFIIGLVAGTGCTIASKALFQMHAIGSNGQLQLFKPPLFQTWVMFIGMAFALPAHFLNEWYRRKNATPAELKLIEAEPAVHGGIARRAVFKVVLHTDPLRAQSPRLLGLRGVAP